MKLDPIRLALVIARIVSGVSRATRAASEGGKKITRSEWDAILGDALSAIAAHLEAEVGDLVER